MFKEILSSRWALSAPLFLMMILFVCLSPNLLAMQQRGAQVPSQTQQSQEELSKSQQLRSSLKAALSKRRNNKSSQESLTQSGELSQSQELSRGQQLRSSLNTKLQTLRKSDDTKKIKYKSPWQRIKDRRNAEKLDVQIGDQIVTITTGTSCAKDNMLKLLQKGQKVKIMREQDVIDASCICCVAKESGRLDTFDNALQKCKIASKECDGKLPFDNEEQFFKKTNILALNAATGVSEKLKVTSPILAEEGVSVVDNSFKRYIWNLPEFYNVTTSDPINYRPKFDPSQGYLNQDSQRKMYAINPYNHHFDPKAFTFFNPWPNSAPPNALKNAASGLLGEIDLTNTQRPWHFHPIPDTAKPPPLVQNGIQATMVGHATVLIQVDGVNILTDPLFFNIVLGKKEESKGPGYKRIKPIGIAFADLPKQLDFIVISHNHRDHLDEPSLKKLEELYPTVQYITPLGYTNFLRKIGVKGKIYELDWWDSIDFPTIRFTALPTQHWCGRGPNDVNQMLWAAYAITTHPDPKSRNPVPSNWRPKSIYFAGDTGYGPHFEEIAKKFPDYFQEKYQQTVRRDPGFDLSLIPIGAYCPMHKEGGGHINPYEAVKVHQILKSKHSVGIHFDTFQLAQEPYGEAKRILEASIKKEEISPNSFVPLEPAEYVSLDSFGKYNYFPNS